MNEKKCVLIKKKQKNIKMHLMYKLFKANVVYVCLQQQMKYKMLQ